MFSGIAFIRYDKSREIRKPNNAKVFGSNNTKGPTDDTHNRLRLLMHERGEL
jgi:hypothetical protein